MSSRRTRNLIPPIYALLILAGFLISAAIGVVVVIVGAALTGILWSMLSGGANRGRDRGNRQASRAARRGNG